MFLQPRADSSLGARFLVHRGRSGATTNPSSNRYRTGLFLCYFAIAFWFQNAGSALTQLSIG
jgi:hypothetical protein